MLCAWTEQLVDMKPKHLSLHFDGVRVSKNAIANAESHIAACEKAITEKNIVQSEDSPESASYLPRAGAGTRYSVQSCTTGARTFAGARQLHLL